MLYAIFMFLSVIIIVGLCFYISDFRKKRFVSDIYSPEFMVKLKYPDLILTRHLSTFYFYTRLFKDDILAYKHKHLDMHLFETTLGIVNYPYLCSVMYIPYTDSDRLELFVSSRGTEKNEAQKFYKEKVYVCNRRYIKALRKILNLSKVTLQMEPIWLEKNQHGTVIIFNEDIPDLKYLESFYHYMKEKSLSMKLNNEG